MARQKNEIPNRAEVQKIVTDISEKYAAAARFDGMMANEKDALTKRHLELSRNSLKESAATAKGRIEYLVVRVLSEATTPEAFENVVTKLLGIFPSGETVEAIKTDEEKKEKGK